MNLALTLARNGIYSCDPNPQVGCVLVKDNKIVGQGWHEKAGLAHAEVNALQQAGEDSAGATAYVTLEPCVHFGQTPPCVDALIRAGVKKVHAAMIDPNPLVGGKGMEKLQASGIEISVGLLEQDARELNPGFIMFMTEKRPFIRLKSAMSLDGKTALANGQSKWITGQEARQDGQKLRAQSSAVLTGIGTILADDPSLNVRLSGVDRQPLRVIVDSNLQTPPSAKTLSLAGRVVIATLDKEKSAAKDLARRGAQIVEIAHNEQKKIDLVALIRWLAEQEVKLLHVEAGATLSGSFIKQGLFDEVVIYCAPKIMGNEAKSLYNFKVENMDEAVGLEITDITTIGGDLKIIARKKGNAYV